MAYLWENMKNYVSKFMQNILRNSEKKNQRFAFSMPFNLTEMV